MSEDNVFDKATCNACGICAEICPCGVIQKMEPDKMGFRQENLGNCVKCGQCMAICPTGSIVIEGLSYEEDFFSLPSEGDRAIAFSELIATRRAVRNFKDKTVPRELLEKVVDSITFAPPGFPPLKTELVVIQDRATIDKALPYMIKMYDFMVRSIGNPLMRLMIKMQAGENKLLTLQNHVIPLMKSRMPELKAGTADTITRHAPAMLIFHANRKAENGREDAYIALTYGFLAAHSLGLGATAIDLVPPAIDRSKELRIMFSIPDSNEVIASMILGYPKYKYRRGIKRKLKNVTWL